MLNLQKVFVSTLIIITLSLLSKTFMSVGRDAWKIVPRIQSLKSPESGSLVKFNTDVTLSTFPEHEMEPALSLKMKKRPIIAICVPTRSLPIWKSLNDTSLHTLLIPSIVRTISAQELYTWEFRLYLGIDHDDRFWLDHHRKVETPDWLSVYAHFYKHRENRVPLNNITRQAFDDGAEYIVRINDDTEFITKDWISKGVETLLGYHPPNLGVVGPRCDEGNTEVLNHDMVHRTHLQVFKDYYPPVFSAWWVDDWITKVYQPGRSTERKDWYVKHHMQRHGTRYRVQHHEYNMLQAELDKGRRQIREWKLRTAKTPIFHIIVLTKDRPKSLQRLLDSIQTSDYGDDAVSVDIHIDGTDPETLQVVKSWPWRHYKTVSLRLQQGGLRTAWLEAWPRPSGRGVILEDDAELFPAWYQWITRAWAAYGNRSDLAGISLKRQAVLSKKNSPQFEIVNDHKPFLYKLVGSVGFSPQPSRWKEFLKWVKTKDLNSVDADAKGLDTSNRNLYLDKTTTWTQLFMKFCEDRGLYVI